jgi:class 3 adenylate cyclase
VIEGRATRYAQTADGLNVAFQTVGQGPDVVFIPWILNHVEALWDDVDVARFRSRMASFSRLIILDQRGSGLSDPVPLNDLPTLEMFVEDVRAVLDAVESERTVLVGWNDGGLIALLFAATYPGRVTGVVLLDGYARITDADDGYRGLSDRETVIDGTRAFAAAWGSGDAVTVWAPSFQNDQAFRERLARIERMSMSPGSVSSTVEMINVDLDVRPILPTIQAPTLVLEHASPWIKSLEPFEQPTIGDSQRTGRLGFYIAEHIEGARYVDLGQGDTLYWASDAERILDEIEEFVTGERSVGTVDRFLATVLFTDIVDSTQLAADLGDRRWRDLLIAHHERATRQIERFRGRIVKTTGDGVLATFDGPARAIRCACSLRDGLVGLGLQLRAGLHTGEIEEMNGDIGGIAVHIAARVEALAQPGDVLVSRTVVDLVAGSGIEFQDRGEHSLKGVPGTWRVFAVGS